MKHVKLFENFQQVNFQTGSVVVGILSEGVDVAVFPREKAMKILRKWETVTNMGKDDYYMPFNFNLDPALSPDNSDLFLVVDAQQVIDVNSFKSNKNYPRMFSSKIDPIVISEGVTLSILNEFDLGNLVDGTPMTVIYKNGKQQDFEGGSAGTYAVELVGGDKYMSAQSYGFGEENGAYEYFMNFFDDMD